VLLIVTSETGNLYEFATPKFSKVLETFKGWYRSSAKDAKRIEVAVCLFSPRCLAAALHAPFFFPSSVSQVLAVALSAKESLFTLYVSAFHYLRLCQRR